MIHGSPFDSNQFGVRVGRLAVDHVGELDRAIEAARGQFDVVFARAPAQAPVVAALAARGVDPLETLVTSTWREPAPPRAASAISVEHHRTLTGADVEAVAAITAEAITRSHFHSDPRLPAVATRQLYAAWARNDVTGRAQATIVAREGGALVGYLALLVADGCAVIDLIAVSVAAHGRGIGSALLSEFVAWVTRERLGARVGTQADNPALALYRRFGFVPTDYQVTYHLWQA